MSTPVLSWFTGTNDIPTDFEAQEVRSIRDDAEDTMRRNNAQIERLEEKDEDDEIIESLTRNNESLSQIILRSRSILSPVRRIPPEVLTHIFLLSAPSLQELKFGTWYDLLEQSPWTLGRICRRWRAVALASPAIWSTIIIHGEYDAEPCSLPMLETQLIRSGTYPLEIFFDCERRRYDRTADMTLEALAKHTARWKTFYIVQTQLDRMPSVRGRVPLLEKVGVWESEEGQAGTDDGFSHPPQIAHFAIAPRLRSVEVVMCYPGFEWPWSQLTRYESRDPWEAHITALHRLKNLESCSLIIANGDYGDDEVPPYPSDRVLQLAKLRQLELSTERYVYGPFDWTCPSWLRLPALTELSIPDAMLDGLPRMLQLSRCSLTTLHITAGCPSVAAILPVFQSNPDITELLITLGRSSALRQTDIGPFIALLSLTPNAPILLPKLSTLILSNVPKDHQDSVGRMITSRWRTANPAVSRLRKLIYWIIGPRLASTLNILQREGLSVCARSEKGRILQKSYGDFPSSFDRDL
ncbi:hypothetical protein B0H16DRAFT_1894815 [Mycena metata]|uniref:F-box domain-containing protein n=1 Tax=Mycena metata TaxID=1033252 RepID=A0AAD7HR51_9AGAR|nr:hypothetical protein B0H16DRAFT_1894815 [Mycena metata]